MRSSPSGFSREPVAAPPASDASPPGDTGGAAGARVKTARVPITFITGPVRSGKSTLAERLALATGGRPVYVATAERHPRDAEWQERLARHRERRGDRFELIETAVADGLSLEDVVASADASQTLLVDSLGTWLAHRISLQLAEGGESIDGDLLECEAQELCTLLARTRARVVIVSEEVGWSVVSIMRSARVAIRN